MTQNTLQAPNPQTLPRPSTPNCVLRKKNTDLNLKEEIEGVRGRVKARVRVRVRVRVRLRVRVRVRVRVVSIKYQTLQAPNPHTLPGPSTLNCVLEKEDIRRKRERKRDRRKKERKKERTNRKKERKMMM